MKKIKKHKIRCYIRKKGDAFFAGCPTLNLTGVGKTIEAAKKDLEDNITLYFETVFKGKKHIKYDEVKHLLKRQAPLSMHVDMVICFVLFHLLKVVKVLTKSNNVVFSEPLPAELCVSIA
jgi:predicted RNase H-like HicB family nuclease